MNKKREYTKRLVIFDLGGGKKGSYYENTALNGSGVTQSWANITPEQAARAPILAEYYDDEIRRYQWQQEYKALQEKDVKIIDAVYPRWREKPRDVLKFPQDLLTEAKRFIIRRFGITCPRCGGSGSYAKSVAFTVMHDGICLRCGGGKKVLPRLTDKKLEEIKKYVLEELAKNETART